MAYLSLKRDSAFRNMPEFFTQGSYTHIPEAVHDKGDVAAVIDEVPPPAPVVPQEVATRDQPVQVAVYAEKSSGVAQDGGKTDARNGYLGKVLGALKKVKLDRRVKAKGTVVVALTVDPTGRVKSREVIRSSGIALLDNAAIEVH